MGGSPEREYLLDNLAAILTEVAGTEDGFDSAGVPAYGEAIKALAHFGRVVIVPDTDLVATLRQHD